MCHTVDDNTGCDVLLIHLCINEQYASPTAYTDTVFTLSSNSPTKAVALTDNVSWRLGILIPYNYPGTPGPILELSPVPPWNPRSSPGTAPDPTLEPPVQFWNIPGPSLEPRSHPGTAPGPHVTLEMPMQSCTFNYKEHLTGSGNIGSIDEDNL